MLTRLKLRLGEGELVEANLEIGRVFSHRRMAKESTRIRNSIHGQFYGHVSHGGRDVSRV